MIDPTGTEMAMTPERVAERVALLIEAISDGLGNAFARHNANLTIDYIEQVHTLGIIDEAQFQALVVAVNDAANAWQPKVDLDDRPLLPTA
jgi:hypothetical protein